MKGFILGVVFTLAVLYPQYSMPKIHKFVDSAHKTMIEVVKWTAHQ